mgnify:CR=1 FL=1
MQQFLKLMAVWVAILSSMPVAIASESQYIESFDGETLHYKIYGSGEETILFVHGWMCDETFWNAQIEEFSNGFQVITLDLPGHGKKS